MAISNLIPQPAEFIAHNWRAHANKTLLGFVDLELPSGLRVNQISVHEKDGSRWLGMPSRAYQKADGSTGYSPQVDFSSPRARLRFQKAALAAIDKLLAEQGEGLL